MIRQKGSYIRLQKRIKDETLKVTVPAHKPVKRSTLAHILKQAKLRFENLSEIIIGRNGMMKVVHRVETGA